MNTNLARLPAATMSGVLSTIAAGLRGDAADVLDLRPDQVCLRTVSLLRSSIPTLDGSLAIGLPVALLGIGIWQYVKIGLGMTSGVWEAYSSFLSHLTVPGSHPLNKQTCDYLSQRGIGQDSRFLTIAIDDPRVAVADSENFTLALKYLPAPKTDAWFKFNGNWIKFTMAAQEMPKQDPRGYIALAAQSDVTLSCFSLTGNVKPIKEFLDHLQVSAIAEKQTMMRIIRYNPLERGNITVLRPTRKLDSIAMSSATKHEMITEMTDYLASENWYADRGIPWRRGYLLYGPPGTGKTSIATAVAGHFNIPLVIIGLSQPGMNDLSLQTAFDCLPRRCVALLEDLDSAGIGREKMAKPPIKAVEWQDDEFDDNTGLYKAKPSSITLSGLLNAIDGPASHEGRILVCTSNSPDSLDPALVRPGRIDKKILFGNATAEVTERLFAHIFEDSTGVRPNCDVGEMARIFATLVPENQVTPAEIQNFLLQHRADPLKVLHGAKAWAKDLLAAKSRGGIVAGFAGQI